MNNKILHDSSGSIIKYNNESLIGFGGFGRVYKIDKDICLKCLMIHYDYDIYAFIKMLSLNLNNFCQIYKILYDDKNRFGGYTMKYYQNCNIDIMTMPIEYTLDNFLRLYDSFKIISNNRIKVVDTDIKNIVMDNNNIVVIDTDLYMIDNLDCKSIIRKNNLNILYDLFASIFYCALGNYHFTLNNDKNIAMDLFSYDKEPDIICKTLSKYKYPIDYFKEKRK